MADVTIIRNRDSKTFLPVRNLKKNLEKVGITYDYQLADGGKEMGTLLLVENSTGKVFRPIKGDPDWWRVVIPKRYRELQRKALLQRLYEMEAEGVIGGGDVENQANSGLYCQDKNQAHDS